MLYAAALSALFVVPVDAPSTAGPKTAPDVPHADEVEFYAAVIAGAHRAEIVCNGYQIDAAVLATVEGKLAIRDVDRPELTKLVNQAELTISERIDKMGVRRWRAAMLDLFGAKGSLVPQLLKPQ
jgi:hypothetical protein